jgi:O-antigen ligase
MNFVVSDAQVRTASQPPRWFLDVTAWTAAFAISGYPIAALISTYYGIADDSITVPFRMFVVALAFASVWAGARRASLSAPDVWLMTFWAIYTFRLIWDSYFASVEGAESALLAFMVTGVVPAVALVLISKTWVERNVVLCLMVLGVLVCLGGWWLGTSDVGDDRAFFDEGGRLGFDKVDPITLGHIACTTLFASVALLVYERSKLYRLLALLAGCLALAMLYLAASRGPLVAFAVGILVFAMCRSVWGYAITAVVVPVVAITGGNITDSPEMLRLEGIGNDASSLERLDHYREALNAFLQYPLLGESYILPISQQWAHNIILDAAMSTGIVGLALLVTLLVRALFMSAVALRSNGIMRGFLFLQFVVGAQFSGTLWSWSGLWIACAMVCALHHQGAHPRQTPIAESSRRNESGRAAPGVVADQRGSG